MSNADSGDDLARALAEDVAALLTESRDTHGDAVENQTHIAEAWTWYLSGRGKLSGDLTGADVSRMMELVKLSRLSVGEYDVDHDRDVAGYAAIAAACEVEQGAADAADLSEHSQPDQAESTEADTAPATDGGAAVEGPSTQSATAAHAQQYLDCADGTTADTRLPWDDPERDARGCVYDWVEAMLTEYGGTFETTVAQIREQIGPDAEATSVYNWLVGMDIRMDKVDDTVGQPTAWRLSEPSTGDNEEDEPVDVTEGGRDSEDADEDTDSTDTDAEAGVEDVVDLSQHTIPVQSRSLDDVEDVPADEVVEAIAGAPNVYRLQGALGCDSDAAEGVLHEIDLYDRFDAAAPLRVGEVRETVKQYLEVAA